MTRGEIRQAVISILRETSTPTGWTAEELNEYINDVYSDTAKETKSVVTTVDIPVAEGQARVDIPVNAIQVLALIDQYTGKPIDHVDWLYIHSRNRKFAEREDSRPRYAAPFGMHQLLIYPSYTPAGTITGTFVTDAVPMTQDSDVPAIPQEYHRGITYGVAHLAMLKDAKKSRLKMAMSYFGRWQKSLGTLSKWASERHKAIYLSLGVNTLRNARGGRGW